MPIDPVQNRDYATEQDQENRQVVLEQTQEEQAEGANHQGATQATSEEVPSDPVTQSQVPT